MLVIVKFAYFALPSASGACCDKQVDGAAARAQDLFLSLCGKPTMSKEFCIYAKMHVVSILLQMQSSDESSKFCTLYLYFYGHISSPKVNSLQWFFVKGFWSEQKLPKLGSLHNTGSNVILKGWRQKEKDEMRNMPDSMCEEKKRIGSCEALFWAGHECREKIFNVSKYTMMRLREKL